MSQLADTEAEAPKKWRVEWETVADTQTARPLGSKSGVFDHIAIASGFFSAPHIPAISGLEDFKAKGQVFHSSNYHDFLYTPRGEKQPKKIVVVGGCLSSVEVVSDLLFNRDNVDEMEVVNLFPRPFWVLPRYLRAPDPLNGPPSFLPFDLVMHDGYRRRIAQKSATEALTMTQEEKNIQINEFMRSKSGNGDQSSLSPHLRIGAEEMRLPPYITISDSYGNFVRSGDVKLEHGYLTSIKQDPETGRWDCLEVSSMSSRADTSDEAPPKERSTTLIRGVDVIIFATGYKPTSFPSFLSQQILKELAYQPNDKFLPLLLYDQILHPSLISYSSNAHSTDETTHVHAGFIGMYNGPYFGVLESQARYLAGLFQGSIKPPPKSELEEQIARFKAMREGRNSGKLELREQASWGDYLGIMEELDRRILEVKAPQPDQVRRGIDKAISVAKGTSWGGKFAPVIPAYYAPYANPECQGGIATFLEVSEQAMKEAKFTAKAVFRSLQGSWKLTRTLNSRLSGMPSGTFVGIAKFIPRRSTFQVKLTEGEETKLICTLKRITLASECGGSGEKKSLREQSGDITEYIYSEHGTFTLSTQQYYSSRKYIYKYHPGTDSISVWFVKPQSGYVPSSTPPSPVEEMEGEVDYLFHEIEFLSRDGVDGERIAKGKEHLCVEDLYKARYKFKFGETPHNGGGELSQFSIGYNVQGPRKDYSSEGIFQRA